MMRKAKRSFLGKVTGGPLAALVMLAMVPLAASPAAAEGQSLLLAGFGLVVIGALFTRRRRGDA